MARTASGTSGAERLVLALKAWALALAVLGSLLPWPGAATAGDDEGYANVTGPCGLEFPRDHGPHPAFRTEWWYWTGNLEAEAGRRFGFQLTFFRRALRPPGGAMPAHPSAWRTDQLYLAHAHLADVGEKRFLQAEDAARGALGLAGVEVREPETVVFLKGWTVRLDDAGQKLHVWTPDFSYDLALTPEKAPVLHGEQGYSRKGLGPASASCYYSYTRLDAAGEVAVGGERFPVKGQAWMDHEYSTALLEPDLAGWDWFSLQLSDGSEVMVFFLREKGAGQGGLSPASSGTFVDKAGSATAIRFHDLRLDVLDHWRSPRSGADYPSRWRLSVPSLGLTLEIEPAMPDQEMTTPGSTAVTYWEGSVSAKGERGGQAVTGRGYVEMTGYGGSMEGKL